MELQPPLNVPSAMHEQQSEQNVQPAPLGLQQEQKGAGRTSSVSHASTHWPLHTSCVQVQTPSWQIPPPPGSQGPHTPSQPSGPHGLVVAHWGTHGLAFFFRPFRFFL